MLDSQRFPWAMILLVAFSIRLGFAYYWHQQTLAEGSLFRFGDSQSYWVLAEHLAAGEAYEYGSEHARVFRAPVLPMVLAPFTLLADPSQAVWWARVFLCLCGAGTVGMLMLAARRLGGDCAGWCCGCLAALYPSAIGMSCLILSEAIFLPFMIGTLLSWQVAWDRRDRRSWLGFSSLAGACAALAVLTRPSWLLFIPFLLLVGIVRGPNRRQHAWMGLMGLLSFCVCMSPWWIRNALVTGKFVPTTLQVGPSLLDSLGPQATGASDQNMDFMEDVLQEQLAVDAASEAPLEGTLEYRLNQRAARQAWQWTASHPIQALHLAFRKLGRTWSLWPDGGEAGSAVIRIGITVGCFGVLALVFVAFLLAKLPSSWQSAIWCLPCIYFTLLHMVFVGSIRYREPAVFVLTVIAGCGLAWLAGCPVKWNRLANYPKQGSSTGIAEPPSRTSPITQEVRSYT